MIYFLQDIDGGPVKIGTTVNLDVRRKQLEDHYGRPLALLATREGGREEEAEIHERFQAIRLGRTEQFRPTAELMAFIGRPLLVGANADAVEAMISNRVAIINLEGMVEYSRWLDDLNRKTHIPKAALFRLAIAEWAERNGHPAPPEF